LVKKKRRTCAPQERSSRENETDCGGRGTENEQLQDEEGEALKLNHRREKFGKGVVPEDA